MLLKRKRKEQDLTDKMKIKEEDFDKLNQLDRIEYLLRIKRIDDRRISSGWFNLFKIYFFAISFIILISFIVVYNDSETAVKLISTLVPITNVFRILIFVCLIIEIYSLITYVKNIKKLQNKFFTEKLEIKTKRSKK